MTAGAAGALGPPLSLGHVTAHVERHQAAPGEGGADRLGGGGLLHGQAAQHDQGGPGPQPALGSLQGADAAPHLDLDPALARGLEDAARRLRGGGVRLTAGGVQVDHVDATGAALHQAADDHARVVLVHLLARVVPLDEADAASAPDVDGGDDDHVSDGSAGLRSPAQAATRLA